MVRQMVGKFNLHVMPDVLFSYRYVFILMLLAMIGHWLPDSWQDRFVRLLQKGGVVGSAIAITVVVFIIMQVKSSEIQPFIYFQF